MDIDFIAYSTDSVISGRLSLGAERLTDLMTDASEYLVDDAAVEALDDRRVVSLAEVAVGRDELLLVVANGPRGNLGRRVRTRPTPVRVGVGPYELFGYAHAMPSSDALASIQRRTIVPLTECRVRFQRGGKLVEHWHDTVLVNRQNGKPLRVLRTETTAALEFATEGDPMQELLPNVLATYTQGIVENSLPSVGQVAGRIDSLLPVAEIMRQTVAEFTDTIDQLGERYLSGRSME